MGGNRRAIVVGINTYSDKNIPPLLGAENDAREVYERLQDRYIGNFDFGNSDLGEKHFLIGAQATCQAIRKAISDVFWKAESSDLALFYFSGHGFVDGYGDFYIAPHDIAMNEPFVCGISKGELRNQITRATPSKTTVVMVLDCCYSGIVTEGSKGMSDPNKVYEDYDKNLKELSSGEGRFILASSAEDQTSREIPKCTHVYEQLDPHPHGAFTYHLIEGLDGQACAENGNGTVSLDDIKRYVGEKLKKDSKQKMRFNFEGGEMDAVEIAREPKQFFEDVERSLAEAKVYRVESLPGLMKAANEICKIPRVKGEYERAKDIRQRVQDFSKSIDVQLATYRNKMQVWLEGNELDIRAAIGDGDYYSLEGTLGYLNLKKIVELEEDKKRSLVVLCDASTHSDKGLKWFIEKMRDKLLSARALTPENEGSSADTQYPLRNALERSRKVRE